MKTKGLVCLLLAAALLLLAMPAVAKGQPEGPAGAVAATATAKTSINFWGGWTGPDKMGMQRIVDAFQKANPNVNVTFFTAPWTEVFAKFSTTFGTSAAPNLMAMHVTDIPQFASRNMLTGVADIAASNRIAASDFPAVVWKGQFYDNVQYGIPLDYHPLAVFKNVQMFQKAGLDPAMEFVGMDGFLAALQKLTVKSGGQTTQYGLAIGSDNPHTERYWYGLLFQAGGSFLNEAQDKAAFNSPAGVRALQFVADLVNRYQAAPSHETDIDKDFLSGRVAMLIEGPWWVPGIKEQSNIQEAVAPFPKIFEQPGVWAGSHTLTVPKQSETARQAAAVQLLAYIVAHSVDWGAAGQIPASLAVQASSAYTSLPDYPYYRAFIGETDAIHYEPILVQNAQFGSDNQLSPIVNAVYGVVLGEKQAKPALDEAAQAIDAMLAK